MARAPVDDDAAIELLPNIQFTRHAEDVFGGDTGSDSLLPRLQTDSTTRLCDTEQSSSLQHQCTLNTKSQREITPSPLKYTPWYWCKIIVTNLAVCLLTIPFFILAAANANLNSKTVVQSNFDKIQSFNKLATTIFPLIFAAIVGRTIVKGAGWLLEMGTRLETLEQLTGSRTVFGTYQTHFLLRSFNILGLVLALIWVMSPLGGQSTSRMLSTGTRSSSTATLAKCIETRGTLNLEDTISPISTYGPLVSAMLSSALEASNAIKHSNLDPLGNVKIPYLQNPQLSWSNYTSYMDPSLYSSVIGIPVFGLQPGTTTLSIESTHMQLNCTALREQRAAIKADAEIYINRPVLVNAIDPNNTWIEVTNETYYGYNWTNGGPGTGPDAWDSSWSLGLNNFPQSFDTIWYQSPDKTNPDFAPIYPVYNETEHIDFNRSALLYQDKSNAPNYISTTNGTFAQCDILQSYVESQLSCKVADSTQNCSVIAQRQSQMPHINNNLTWFHTNFPAFSFNLPRLRPTMQDSVEYDILQLYINRGDTDLMFSQDDLPPLPVMDPVLFGRRLGQIINAYGIGNIAPNIYVGEGGEALNSTTGGTPIYQNITGTLTTTEEVYVCSWPWFAVFLTSTLIMFCMSILGAYYDMKKHTPDILGYCSILTRDMKYVTVGPGDNLLDGLDRTRHFKDLRLRFGDVGIVGKEKETKESDGNSSEMAVGHLAVADEDRATRARKGQLYV